MKIPGLGHMALGVFYVFVTLLIKYGERERKKSYLLGLTQPPGLCRVSRD